MVDEFLRKRESFPYKSGASLSKRAVKSLNVRCFTRFLSNGPVLPKGDGFIVHKEVVSMVTGFFLMNLVAYKIAFLLFPYSEDPLA